jgi:DNA-directed RNA polymerase specialized sigma24 family protein
MFMAKENEEEPEIGSRPIEHLSQPPKVPDGRPVTGPIWDLARGPHEPLRYGKASSAFWQDAGRLPRTHQAILLLANEGVTIQTMARRARIDENRVEQLLREALATLSTTFRMDDQQ